MNKYEILRKYYGYDNFRGMQADIIDALLAKKDVLAIMATGGGKSICFQIPALMATGVTLVITPLISLMCDQVTRLKSLKIKAAYLNSEQSYFATKEVYQALDKGELKLLYLSPERLENREFQNRIKSYKISYIIIDEAHCISIWGNDFRTCYKEIGSFICSLEERPTIGAFTATANEKSAYEIVGSLKMRSPQKFFGTFDRKNLFYGVVKPKDKYTFLLKYLTKHRNEAGIIYTLTRKECEEISAKLTRLGFENMIYHGGLTTEEKNKNQKKFLTSDCLAIATNAFGMGIDKSNIRFIINYQLPITIEDLVQQAGRCSRDGAFGECILLYDTKDLHICEYFIENSVDGRDTLSKKIKREKYDQLKWVIKYAESKQCRHQFISSYFGEHQKRCGCYCNNCRKR